MLYMSNEKKIKKIILMEMFKTINIIKNLTQNDINLTNMFKMILKQIEFICLDNFQVM